MLLRVSARTLLVVCAVAPLPGDPGAAPLSRPPATDGQGGTGGHLDTPGLSTCHLDPMPAPDSRIPEETPPDVHAFLSCLDVREASGAGISSHG